MKNKTINFAVSAFTAFFCLTLLFPAAAKAQRRDYLSNEEIELVRDAQEIDLRIEVLTKAIGTSKEFCKKRLTILTTLPRTAKRTKNFSRKPFSNSLMPARITFQN